MSATLGNTAPIEERLAARSGREVASVTGLERPVPLEFEYRETPIHETVAARVAARRAPCIEQSMFRDVRRPRWAKTGAAASPCPPDPIYRMGWWLCRIASSGQPYR
jgi:superfamily II RNA helicase